MSSRRLFIGLKISGKLPAEIFKLKNQYLKLPVRWLKPENLHLTLVPPFYEDAPEKIMEKLSEVEGLAAPVKLRFHTISYGPRPGDFRLIWAVGQEAPELEKLKRELEKKLKLKPERKNFLPHLTLARFRPENFSGFKIKNLQERIDWPEPVSEFILFESVLKPGGAEYKILYKKSFLDSGSSASARRRETGRPE